MNQLTNTILDNILDGKIQISDLNLTVEEHIQICEKLKERQTTREENGVVDNRVFLQEDGIFNTGSFGTEFVN